MLHFTHQMQNFLDFVKIWPNTGCLSLLFTHLLSTVSDILLLTVYACHNCKALKVLFQDRLRDNGLAECLLAPINKITAASANACLSLYRCAFLDLQTKALLTDPKSNCDRATVKIKIHHKLCRFCPHYYFKICYYCCYCCLINNLWWALQSPSPVQFGFKLWLCSFWVKCRSVHHDTEKYSVLQYKV